VLAAALAGALAAGLVAIPAGAEVQAFFAATVHPAAGPPIAGGAVLLVEDARVLAVGVEGEVEVAAGAVRYTLAGKVLIPGLVDTHSHIGDDSGGDASKPLQPEVRALDGIDIRSPSFGRARAGGITTVNVMLGSGLLLSGQTAYLKLRAEGSRIEDWLLCVGEGRICGGLKMANGTNPQRPAPGAHPQTRAKAAQLVRELFIKAQEHQARVAAAEGDAAKLPPRDLGLEALIEALEGRRVVHYHTHRADDIATVLRLAREFGFPVVLHHVSDGWALPEAIAAAGGVLGAAINVMDSPGGKHENAARRWETPAILATHGVPVAIQTDDSVTDSRFLLRSAALAVRGGLDREEALRALTVHGTRMLGLDHRLGTLAPGKDADFVVLSGDPFSVWTLVEETWVDGRRVFSRAGETRIFQTGGYGVFRGGSTAHDDGVS
jgi:imidazolonepropionase-like amidohydrolase